LNRDGKDRSSFLAAIFLGKEGYTPTEAVSLLRIKRSKHALFNKTFEAYLHAQERLNKAS
jgi:hypothetical protein